MLSFFHLLVIAGNVFIGYFFISGIYKQKIAPSFPMWFFFFIATFASYVTFLKEGSYAWEANLLNLADVVLTFSVGMCILAFQWKKVSIKTFEIFCCFLVFIVMIFWFFTQSHFASNSLLQIVMVISYLPAIRGLWKSAKNTEPWLGWLGLFVVPVVSLATVEGVMAYSYSLRAIVSTLFYMALMARAEYRSRQRMADSRIYPLGEV